MAYRSLLIISVPRSGSTPLEQVCFQFLRKLGFQRSGEFLNPGFNKKLRFPQYAGKKHHKVILERCMEFRYNHVVRDVVQNPFLSNHAIQLQKYFNIIVLMRPIAEVNLCCKMLGWKMPSRKRRKYQEMLEVTDYSDTYVRLDYYDFIFKRKPLVKILKKWYPGCRPVNYLTPEFIQKRETTLRKVRKHLK